MRSHEVTREQELLNSRERLQSQVGQEVWSGSTVVARLRHPNLELKSGIII